METTTLGALFLKGGWVMWPLLIFSVMTWAILFERLWVFLKIRPRLRKLSDSVLRTLQTGDTQSAKQLCHSEKPPVGELFLVALENKKPKETVEKTTERQRQHLTHYLKRNLWILGTISSASPFVGLLGTVVGIVRAFHDMAEKGSGGFSVVAAGISEALIATAAGLVVAIIAMVTYNVFVTAANQTTSHLKLMLEEVIEKSYSGV